MDLSDFEAVMNGNLQIPPTPVLTDFDAFAAAMTAAPLADLHKFIDSDDGDDLDDDYAGDSDSDDTSSDGDGDEYDGFPSSDYEHTAIPHTDIDLSKLESAHAASNHLDPELQRTIDETEIVLEQLSIQAQKFIEEQPLSTQIVLSNQAVDSVLKPYGYHGSQARLSEGVMKFLSGGDTVRRPGKAGLDKSKDGKLRFTVEPDGDEETRKGRDRRSKLKRRADDDGSGLDGVATAKMKVARRGQQITVSKRRPRANKENEEAFNNKNVISGRDGYGFQHTSIGSLDGSKVTDDALPYRKISGPIEGLDIPTIVRKSSIYSANSPDAGLRPDSGALRTTSGSSNAGTVALTPLTATFSNIQLKTPTMATVPAALRSSPAPSTYNGSSYSQPRLRSSNYSTSIDPSANAALARQSYNPVSMRFTWPATTRVDGRPCMPTPGLLANLNRILHLTNAEARFMLSYYVRKYDTPVELVGSTGRVRAEHEPPHALFRLGISQYLYSQMGKIVDHKESDELGLTPEVRRVLREAWQAHPSTLTQFDDDFLSEPEDEDETMENDEDEEMIDRNDLDADGDIVFVTDTLDGSVLQRPRKKKPPKVPKRADPSIIKGGLNPIEKVLLARACTIPVQMVEAYWENMCEKTKAWGAMKLWCQARSREKVMKAKT